MTMPTFPVETDTQRRLRVLAQNAQQAQAPQQGPFAVPQPSTDPFAVPGQGMPGVAGGLLPFAAGLGQGISQGLQGIGNFVKNIGTGQFGGAPTAPPPLPPATGFAQGLGRAAGSIATLGMGEQQQPFASTNFGRNTANPLEALSYYAPAGAEAAMVGPAFKGYAGAAGQRTGRVVGAAVKGGERGFASFGGGELSNVDKELAALDQRIAAATKAGQDTVALESERAATQELRQHTIEARMTDEQVTQYRDLQQRQQELQGQLDAQAAARTANILRPPKTTPGGLGIWSNAKLKALAEHEGVDPYREDWWDSLDSKVVAEFRNTRVAVPTTTDTASLRAQLADVGNQLKDFESGMFGTPKAQTLEQYLKEHGVSDYTDAGLHSPRGNMGRQANRAIAKRMDANYAAYTRAKQDYDQLVRAGVLTDPLRGKSVITPSEETIAAQQRVAERRAARAGSLQASMGIGEKPAQGQLLGEFQGKAPEQTPLIDAAQVQDQAARRAEVAAGQRPLPEVKASVAAGAPPEQPPVVPPTATGGAVPPGQPPTPPQDVVAKLTQLVQSAKPARAETEVLKHQELGKRVAVYSKTLEAGSGESAFQQARGALTGQLPVAQFEPPKVSLTADDVTSLFERIRTLPEMQPLTKGNTADALQKVLMGAVPTEGEITLLEKVFGPELAQALLDKRGFWARFKTEVLDAANAPRAVLSSSDFSAPMRQGILLGSAHPKEFVGAMPPMFKAWWSDDMYRTLEQSIRTDAAYPVAEAAGLYLPELQSVSTGLTTREEAFMSRLAERLPLVKRSERAYVGYLNKLRFDVFKTVTQGWEGQGKSLADYRDMARVINAASGRGDTQWLSKNGPLLNAMFFSPRFIASRVQVPFGVFSRSKAARMEVARELTTFVGTGVAILSMMKMSGAATVELDPRSSDFGKGRVGPTRFDFWAGYQPLARYTAQLMTGQMKPAQGGIDKVNRLDTAMRFLRSKLAPAPGLGVDVLQGRTYTGQKLSAQPMAIADQVYQRVAPLFLQDMVDAVNLQGPKGVALAAPGIFGVGVQSYTPNPTPAEQRKQKLAQLKARLQAAGAR